jgi:hypothetical protein
MVLAKPIKVLCIKNPDWCRRDSFVGVCSKLITGTALSAT